MYEVTVEADFSSGHYLRNYQGKCENPHGHNYKVRITLAGAELDEAGLLLDFKLLKQVLRPVVERIDHQMLNDLEPFTTLNPSAENIAKYFYDETSRSAGQHDRRPRARERLHHLGDGHDDCDLFRVAAGSSLRASIGSRVRSPKLQFISLDFDCRYLLKGTSKEKSSLPSASRSSRR